MIEKTGQDVVKPAQFQIKQYMAKNNLIKVKIQFEDKKRIMLVSPSHTLTQLQINLKRIYSLSPTEGLFLFVGNKQIIDGRTTIGSLKQILGQNLDNIVIKATIAQKF